MSQLGQVFGLHQWERESIDDLFEEFPELQNMTTDELKQKSKDFYLEAAGLYDRAKSIEAKADTIELYIKYFRGAHK